MSENLQKEVERGHQAQRWLDDPVTKEAFGKVRQGILDKWADSPVEDKDGQYTLRLMLKLLDEVHRHVSDVAVTGHMAASQIRAMDELKRRANGFLNKWGVRV